jgi:excisionase family DNA binding protein
MTTLVEDYATVDEAAALMRVAPSTIRRWIREGVLPAFRVGRRRLAVRRTDLTNLIVPARTGEESGSDAAQLERRAHRRLTPEEQERGLAAFERAQRLSGRC